MATLELIGNHLEALGHQEHFLAQRHSQARPDCTSDAIHETSRNFRRLAETVIECLVHSVAHHLLITLFGKFSIKPQKNGRLRSHLLRYENDVIQSSDRVRGSSVITGGDTNPCWAGLSRQART